MTLFCDPTPPPLVNLSPLFVQGAKAAVEPGSTQLASSGDVSRRTGMRRSTIDPFPCGDGSLANDGSPIQVLNSDEVSVLNTNTGVYAKIWDLPLSNGNQLSYMNAADINPIDGLAYGVCQVTGNTEIYLCRFDSSSVEFLAQAAETLKAAAVSAAGIVPLNSGTIDASGNYWVLSNSATNTAVLGLYKVERPDQMTGYTDSSDGSIPTFGSSKWATWDINYSVSLPQCDLQSSVTLIPG